jgi:hypothetical protein
METQVDALCEKQDPESTPYASKYKAREMLDKLIQKLSAAQTIASLEKKKQVAQDMESRVAACEVKVGTISYECDEPHNCETELNRASAYYFEGFVDNVNTLCASSQVIKYYDKAINLSNIVDLSFFLFLIVFL